MADMRMLIVEDNKELRRVYHAIGTHYLQDYILDVVDSGLSALEAFESMSYNIVITDMNMPGMSGVKLYEAVCTFCKDAPIGRPAFIFVSGVKTALDGVRHLCEGEKSACRAILKPFAAQDIKRLVDELVKAEC